MNLSNTKYEVSMNNNIKRAKKARKRLERLLKLYYKNEQLYHLTMVPIHEEQGKTSVPPIKIPKHIN